MSFSAFKAVESVDTWPYYQQSPEVYRAHISDYFYFMLEGQSKPLGYVHADFVAAIAWPSYWQIDEGRRMLTLCPASTFDQRTAQMKETLLLAYEKSKYTQKWHGELYPLRDTLGNHTLDMDGCGAHLFGTVSFSVNVTAYVNTSSGIKLWVSKRVGSQGVHPDLFDTFCVGNIVEAERPLDCVVRRIVSSTGISESYTTDKARACGMLNYMMSSLSDGKKGCRRQCQFSYELELNEGQVPTASNGDGNAFALLSIEELRNAIDGGSFPDDQSLPYIAYFIRHGVISAENEPRYAEVEARIHRNIDIFVA